MSRSERFQNRKKSKNQSVVKKILAIVLLFAVVVSVRVMTDAYLDAKAMKELQTGNTPDWIEKQYLDKDGRARPEKALEEINGIVIHYVANPGSSAEANRNYFNKPETGVSSHFIVGLDGEIIQCIPLAEQSVASNNRNHDTIAIEVCHPDDSGKFSQTTMKSLIELTSWLVKKSRLNEDDVIRHYDVTGKLCPKYYVENQGEWEYFKSQLD